MDQALLCLSVPRESGGRQPREGLRMFGIRTATDLIRVWDSTRPGAHQVRARVATVLAGVEETGAAAAEAILASLAGNPNLRARAGLPGARLARRLAAGTSAVTSRSVRPGGFVRGGPDADSVDHGFESPAGSGGSLVSHTST